MGLTERQQRAVARARADLEAECEDVEHGSAYWRGWLRHALATLIDELSEDEGGKS